MADRRNPWMKFFPADWRSDPRLRMCSLAARGLWMEMLALMHEAQPYGHLLIAGRHPTDTQLSALVGAPSDQIPDLIRELEANGVFSRTREKVIFSRRMVTDEKKARISRKNGKEGGNPTLRKQMENQTWDKQQDKGGDKAQKPEARYQNKEDTAADAHATSHAGSMTGGGLVEIVEPDRSPKPGADPAVAMIAAFDAAITSAYGPSQARPWPHQTDKITADKWAAAGIDLPLVQQIAGAVMARSRQAGRGPPKALSYLTSALMDALTDRAKPLEFAHARQSSPSGRNIDPRTVRGLAAWDVADAVLGQIPVQSDAPDGGGGYGGWPVEAAGIGARDGTGRGR